MVHRRYLRWVCLCVVTASCGDGCGGVATDEAGSAAISVTDDGATAGDGSLASRCELIRATVQDAGFGDKVTVTCDETKAFLTSDTFPNHTLMTGITGSNEQIPVPALNYAAPVPLNPVVAAQPTTRDAALGTAINGVPIYDYTAAGELSLADLENYDARLDTVVTGQLDVCGGHSGRGDDYHYHKAPNCMIEAMENPGPDAILGWGLDGFPIYGDDNPDGSEIADGTLDVCNGQSDAFFGYRYHTSSTWPYVLQCITGEVEEMDLPRVPPLDNVMGGPKEGGTPPAGGVQNLVMVETEGTQAMTYEYQGESYYIRYSPSGTANCYDFEYRTVTNGGVAETGEYCR